MESAETGYFVGRMEDEDIQFDVQSDKPILMSAELGGVNLPSSCRVGNCRTCISLLTEGQVHYQMEWPGLSKEEKAEGYILPCVAYPDSDIRIRFVGL